MLPVVEERSNANGQPMRSKTVVITGGNTGIGKETAVELARLGARVVITSRDPRRGATALDEIRARSGRDDAVVMDLDLASLDSVRDFAQQLLARYERLDVLVENAGLVVHKRRESADGFEMTFGINHLGDFLLTALVRDRLVASAPARVLVVASDAHRSARSGLDFDDLQSTKRYRASAVYGKSKLANILFALELARRLEGTGVTSNSLHPGVVATRFGRDGDLGWLGRIGMPLVRPFVLNASQGAQTSVYLASSPDVEGITGLYWYKCTPAQSTRAAQDDAAARRLWDESVRLVGLA